MKKLFILAIDQGTTGTTVRLINLSGRIVARAYQEIKPHYPRPSWVEQDAVEIWRTTLRVCGIAFDQVRIVSAQIAAIGITNQRETIVVWDRKSGRPLHRAIVWQCRRTTDQCQRLKRRGLEPLVRKKTGLLIDPYFSGTKIQWLLDEIGGLRRRAVQGEVACGTVDTWLLWNLTGGAVHATDFTNASRTLLFNIQTKQWDRELLRLFRIPRAMLADIYPTCFRFGTTVRVGPFVSGIPIYAMCGDQQAALFGQSAYEVGETKNTYGTGCFLMMNTGQRCISSRSGLITTLCCDREGGPAYALEGSVFIAGAAIQWLRDGLKIIRHAAQTEEIARRCPRDSVFVVPAFVGLGAPYWDPQARGAILGLTRGTTLDHIIKATLESIAYQTCDVLFAMQKDSGLKIRALKVDGGAVRNNYLMQFQADLLGLPVWRSAVTESTAWGVAKLAAKSAGLWPDLRKVDRQRIDRIFYPKMSRTERRERYDGWQMSIRKVLA